MILNTGRWSRAELDNMIRQASLLKHAGEKVEFISENFLDTAYRESTLTGNADTEEVLVINLEGVDCFTLLDYVEAMRSSGSFDEFIRNIEKVRYRDRKIAFPDRNHFFTDWREYSSDHIDDVTAAVSGGKARKTVKMLNLKADGSYFLPGIKVERREIWFILSDDLDSSIIDRLESGDYIGIYSPLDGLDVSHAGIFVRKNCSVCLRHASSAEGVGRVVDDDLLKYISAKPGLVVLRPKA